MRYFIDKTKKEPAYLQLYIQMREDIVNGVYKNGEKLPSKRLVADEMEISTITVEHTYSLLAEEGYIEPRERSGYFVIFKNSDYLGKGVASRASILPLPHAEHTEAEFPFSVLSRVMRKVITERGEGILLRTPNKGGLELRNAISAYLFRSRGIRADIDEIIIGSGAEYLYGLVVGLLGRERIFALESPSYEKIQKVYLAEGVSFELLPLTSDGIDSSALSKTKADVLHISPYRSYPSGVTASASKRHEYIRWAQKDERYIIEDDFESEFSVSKKNEETLFTLSDRDNIIYMNTFSKTVSPALRVGYMVIPKRLTERFDKRLGFYSCTVPTFEQLLLTELITNGDFERNINRVRRKKRKENG